MDEFFAQGDEEKKLGIPVGLLNDREKASIPGSQFGFTSMLFTPLVMNMTYVFPMVSPIAQQAVQNNDAWLKAWMLEPGYKETNQRAKVRKFQEQVSKFVKAAEAERGQSTPLIKSSPSIGQAMEINSTGFINLAGLWTCTATWGLEDFLKSTNVSWARRKAAMGAPWPSWEFTQGGNHIVFTNHTAMGILKEEINANKEPFTIVDGWKQQVNCLAYWDGKALIIEKKGPQGEFKESRLIDENEKLQFVLQPVKPEGPKWGRTFERDKNPKK